MRGWRDSRYLAIGLAVVSVVAVLVLFVFLRTARKLAADRIKVDSVASHDGDAISYIIPRGLEGNLNAREKGAHWSQDFVEHLRTVHFALIAVSVGLIALSLAHPTGPLEKALKQLQQIEKAVDLGKEKDSDWVDEWSTVDVKSAITTKKISTRTPLDGLIRAHGEVISTGYYCKVGDTMSDYELTQGWALIPDLENLEAVDQTFIRSQLPNEGAVIETQSLGVQKDMKLDDFKRIWNFLHHKISVVVPMSIGLKVFLWDGQKLQWDEYPCTQAKQAISGRILAFLHIGLLADSERWAKLAHRVGDEPPRYGYVSDDKAVFVSLDQFQTVDFNGQGWFIGKNPTWASGRFTDSFPELDEASVGISNQNLDTLKGILENKQKEIPETFDAAGIKIPADVVMQFGILLVLGVQIYFLAHLAELSRRLRPIDPGWDVAWIGVYTHKIARVVYFCTICVLPVICIVALGKRGLDQSSYDAWSWVILFVGIVPNVLLAILIWKWTPRRGDV
jgi:hypothetical protein